MVVFEHITGTNGDGEVQVLSTLPSVKITLSRSSNTRVHLKHCHLRYMTELNMQWQEFVPSHRIQLTVASHHMTWRTPGKSLHNACKTACTQRMMIGKPL